MASIGYLFKVFDKNGYEAEIKRHNRALEDLAKLKELFHENEVKHDRIKKLTTITIWMRQIKLLIC